MTPDNGVTIMRLNHLDGDSATFQVETIAYKILLSAQIQTQKQNNEIAMDFSLISMAFPLLSVFPVSWIVLNG